LAKFFAACGYLIVPMQPFDGLFRAKGAQHADDDNPYLTDESSPAVQRFWKVEMHAKWPPDGRRLTDAVPAAIAPLS